MKIIFVSSLHGITAHRTCDEMLVWYAHI
jgi:hypothetical protein